MSGGSGSAVKSYEQRLQEFEAALKKPQNMGMGNQQQAQLDLPFYDIFAPRGASKVAQLLAGKSEMDLSTVPVVPYVNGKAQKGFTFYPQNPSGSYNASDANAQMTRYLDSVGAFIYEKQEEYLKAMKDAKGNKNKERIAKQQLDKLAKNAYKKDFDQLKKQYADRDRLYNQANAIADVLSEITGMRRGLALAYLQQYTGDPYERIAKGIVGRQISKFLPKGNKVIDAAALAPVEKAVSILQYDQPSLEKNSSQGYAALKQAEKNLQRAQMLADFVVPTVVANSKKQARMIAYKQPPQREKYTDTVLQRYSTGLGTPATRPIEVGAMSSFPQWMFRQIQSSKKRRTGGYMSILAAKRMNDPKDPVMSAMSALDPKLAVWDAGAKKWTGTWAEKQQINALKKADRYNARNEMSQQILTTAYTDQQIRTKVPDFIKQLVQANNDITGVGMGPLKQGGVGLYAGRWLDPVSGRVRVLPVASQKYINPFVAGQKKAFLQARILNKWNQIQTYYQEYVNFNESKYQSSQLKKVQSGLNPVQNEITANRKISKTIEAFFSSFPNPQNMKWLLLDCISSEKLSKIYSMEYPQTEVKKIRNAKIEEAEATLGRLRIQEWQTVVRQGAAVLQKKISQSDQSQLTKSKLLLRMQQTMISLLSVGGQGKTAIKMLLKGLTIPVQASVQETLKAKQKYDILQQQLKMNNLSIGNLRTPADYLASNQLWKSTLKPAIRKMKKQQQVPIQAVASYIDKIGQSTGVTNRLQQASELRQFIESKPYRQSLQNIAGRESRNKTLPYISTFKTQTLNPYYV